jgi:hypothetical protein
MAKPPAKKPASRKKAKEEAPPAELAPTSPFTVPLGAQMDFPANPTTGQIYKDWEWDGTRWRRTGGVPSSPPIAFSFVIPGKPPAEQRYYVPIVFPVNILSAIGGPQHQVWTGVAPAGPNTMQVLKASGQTGMVTETTLLTITGGASFTGFGGSLAVGDRLVLKAPSTQDANMADIGITILATRV